MDQEYFQKYLKDRYYSQVDWYDRKSMINQKTYKRLQYSLIILSSLTPILIVVSDWQKAIPYLVVVPALTSVAVAILTSIIKTFRFQENWINYRTTCETLRKEIFMLEADIGEYAQADNKESLFIERVESLISRENTLWLASQKPEKTQKK